MKVATSLCALLSLAYALPSPRMPRLLPRSSTSGDAATLNEDGLDLFDSNIGSLTSPELPAGLGDASDITSTGIDGSATLSGPFANDPQNLLDSSLSATGGLDSTDLLCSGACQSSDLSMPLGFNPDFGNMFETDEGSDGIYIPLDDAEGSEPGTWVAFHRGSGRNKQPSLDGTGLGNDILFMSDEDEAGSDPFGSNFFV